MQVSMKTSEENSQGIKLYVGKMNQLASRIVIIGGLVQILVSISLLFFPVLVTCQITGENKMCHGESYIQQGGNILGYTFLLLMIAAGIVAIASSRDLNPRWSFFSRWLVALSNLIIVIITGWGFGMAFLPGTLILLLSAIFTKPWSSPSSESRGIE